MPLSAWKRLCLAAVCLTLVLAADLWVHGPAAARWAQTLHLQTPERLGHLFWDTEPYRQGIADVLAGRSPYTFTDLTYLLPFAYPPAFAWAGAALARVLPAPLGFDVYIALYTASMYLLVAGLAAFFVQRLGRAEVFALVCLTPLCLTMSTVFLSGNIHVLWYALALVAAVPGVRRGSWWVFFAVVLLAMVNQPVFVLLLLLPLFAGRRTWLPCAMTAGLAALAYQAQGWIAPALYQQFRASVTAHLMASRDFGQGVFGITARLLGPQHTATLPAILQITFSLGVVLCLIVLAQRVSRSDPRWLALIALAIVLANPRVMPYDVALGLAPALFFLLYGVRRGWQWLPVLVSCAACLAAHRVLGFLPLLLAGFVAGVWNLGAERERKQKTESPGAEGTALVSAGT